MSNDWIFGLVFIASGLFSLIASIKDWNFFFGSIKARLLVSIVGRNGARILFGVLGFVIIIVGILSILGKVDLASDF
ncbi:immunity 17 family protein [Cellulophaga sp. HaHaR_3_176]|uniref:immunity 17 family protein n=1 Tax=Cellulophaga sp. HaHaR_3_176 TaxID=1942464 RepID=UPI001C1FAA2B|nr:immunity 17 family protein [Cellulophaga sp. HaHaR_3_176]QWX84602.1 immunity 17 family protein [Cellulophaga sp. HaHaR_3_176]